MLLLPTMIWFLLKYQRHSLGELGGNLEIHVEAHTHTFARTHIYTDKVVLNKKIGWGLERQLSDEKHLMLSQKTMVRFSSIYSATYNCLDLQMQGIQNPTLALVIRITCGTLQDIVLYTEILKGDTKTPIHMLKKQTGHFEDLTSRHPI